jgi:hypothetical protein
MILDTFIYNLIHIPYILFTVLVCWSLLRILYRACFYASTGLLEALKLWDAVEVVAKDRAKDQRALATTPGRGAVKEEAWDGTKKIKSMTFGGSRTSCSAISSQSVLSRRPARAWRGRG